MCKHTLECSESSLSSSPFAPSSSYIHTFTGSAFGHANNDEELKSTLIRVWIVFFASATTDTAYKEPGKMRSDIEKCRAGKRENL